MRKAFIVSVLALVAALLSPSAAVAALPDWNLTGTYTIVFTCTAVCTGDYPHTMTIDIVDLQSDPGTFAGTGYYNKDLSYTWNILNGTLSGSIMSFDVDYTGSNPSYALHVDGQVQPDGTLAGTASSNSGQRFTWKTTSGTALPYCHPAADHTGFTYTNDAVYASAVGSGSVTPVVTVNTTPGAAYVIEASRTFYAGGNSAYDIQADAEYSQDAYQRANNMPWTDSVHGYESYGEQLLDLLVDGGNVDWGAFDPSHVYSLTKQAGSSMSFSFNIYDIYAQNNTGGLCVSLFKDSVAPVVSPVGVAPAPAKLNGPITISGTIDDSATGGSLIASAEYRIDGGSWTAMDSSDGAFDETAEDVTASTTASTLGLHTACVRGTDAAGNTSGDGVCTTFVTEYVFAGFFLPVDNPNALNSAKAGQAIPVKWRLTDANGIPVSDPASFVKLTSQQGAGACAGLDPDGIEEYAAGSSGLQYLGDGYWQFNWKTPKSYAGQCRTMTLNLLDGSTTHTAYFKFR